MIMSIAGPGEIAHQKIRIKEENNEAGFYQGSENTVFEFIVFHGIIVCTEYNDFFNLR